MLVILALIAAISLPPKPDHYVTDRAGVVTNAKALDDKLAQFERDTSDQILVYVDQHLPPDTTIEVMGSEAMRQWGVGQKGKDNGAILFIFIADRKMRIEVGYGLEGALTDAKSREIIETVIKPQFQRGDFSAGIDQGVSAIIATIKGEPYRGTGQTVAETQPASSTLLEKIFAVIWRWAFRLFWWGAILHFVYYRIRYKKNPPWATPQSGGSGGTTYSSGGSSSSWSSSSSSSSSSSFSGGGGSGGGGGASGSW